MGMLQVTIKKVSDHVDASDMVKRMMLSLEEYFEEQDNSCDCESYNVGILREHNFEEIWEVQETYKNTPEIKEKYKNLAKEGKLIYIEVEY
jgi:hypothetical protein